MTSDNSVEAILQEFRAAVLKDVNAKVCAPELRREEVIAEGTKTDIAQARSVKEANGILNDYLRENCTLDQIVMLSKVLMDVDNAYRRTRTLGQRLHARTQGLGGGGTHQQESQNRSQIHQSLPENETSAGNSNRRASLISDSPPPSTLRPARVLLVFAVLIPCAAVVVKGLPICLPPWPFTNIWQRQMCWEGMPWPWDTSMEESELSTATPDESLSTSSVVNVTDHPQPMLLDSGLDTEDTPLSTSSAATTANHPQPTLTSTVVDTEDVQMEKPDVKLTTEELHSLQTITEDDLVWIEIGVTGVGKSMLGNFLLGKHVFEVGGALVSVTDKAQVNCSVLDGHRMCIVDTPGFGDTHRMGTQNTEAENLANDAAHLVVELSKTMLMARHGVHAFFVVVRADSRELFSTTKLLDLLDILGNYWDHTILVLTHGKGFDKTSEDKQYEKFEAMLNSPGCPEMWKTLVEKVNKRYVIVEPEDWKDDRAYYARKVKELKEHSSAIAAAHGPYNDTLHSLLKEYIETAKLELRNEFEDMDSPEAQVAALQVAFQNVTAMLYKLIRIKLAGGVDTELLQAMAKTKEEELSEVRRQRDQLHQQFLKEQEEKRKAQEAENRAREAQRVAEEQARVAREAEEKARRELEEYLKKPTFAERVVEARITREGFYKWRYVYIAEAEDVATGITANAKNYKSKDGAKEHARINLKAILLEKGIISKD